MTQLYGIKNCTTVRKAIAWLADNNIPFTIHDYKKDGIPTQDIQSLFDEFGWENVINQRSATWRNLDDIIKESMNDENALAAANQNPAVLKRPIVVHNGKTLFGFKADEYAAVFTG